MEITRGVLGVHLIHLRRKSLLVKQAVKEVNCKLLVIWQPINKKKWSGAKKILTASGIATWYNCTAFLV